jgi:hypothetical protein
MGAKRRKNQMELAFMTGGNRYSVVNRAKPVMEKGQEY